MGSIQQYMCLLSADGKDASMLVEPPRYPIIPPSFSCNKTLELKKEYRPT